MNKKTAKYKETDNEYQNHELVSVREDDDRWSIEIETGWHFSINRIENHTPEVGHSARFYGKGIGFTVRGVDIDGVIYYYNTPEQTADSHKKMCEKHDKEALERFEKNKEKNDASYDILPDILKKRMDRLRTESPDDRHKWEPYEMFILVESAKIFDALKTPEAIEEFHQSMSFAEQLRVVPALDEGHSGNTFGCATRFAYQMAKGVTEL